MEIRVPGLLEWDSGGEQFTNYLRIRKWNVHPQLIKPNSSQFI